MNTTNTFIHLRVLSSYSLLQSMNTIEKLCQIANKYNIQHLPITDNNNLFGSLEFSITAKQYNITPIIGAIVPIDQNETKLLILAKNKNGYQNLIKLISYYYQNKKYISIDILLQHNEDLIVLSGYTQGPIGYHLLKNDTKKAIYYTEQLQKIFQDRFYYEIMRHGLESENSIEYEYIQLSLKYNIPLVATNNILFSFKEQHQKEKTYQAHDTLWCIANNNKKEDNQRLKSCSEYYFKSPEEMIQLFADIPNAIKNTIEIAKRCAYSPIPQKATLPKFCKNENTILKNQSITGLFTKLQYDNYANESQPYTFDKKKKYTLKEKTEILKNNYLKYYERMIYELNIICILY
ncbi:MAG: PHP domain-containing protein, partial [Pseudomonadota bacterium]